MIANQGFVAELSPTDKVPGAYINVIMGVGGTSNSSIPKYLLIVGMPSSAGHITPDAAVVDIYSEADADYWFGAGSEAALMCYAALAVGGVRIKAASASMSAGAKSTATITIDNDGSAWTSAGTWTYRVGGKVLTGTVLSTDSISAVASSIAAKVNGTPKLPVTAVASAGAGTSYIVTLTNKSEGVRGNRLILWQDTSGLPAHMTSTLGGAATSGSITATGFPKALANGMTFLEQVDGAGGPTTKTIVAHNATLTLTGGSYAAGAGGESLTIRISVAGQLITTTVDLSGATNQQGYADCFNQQVTGISAVVSAGNIVLTVDQGGSGSSGAITAISGASVTTKLGASASTFTLTGGSNVADVQRTTSAELATVLAIAGSTFASTATTLTWTSSTTGLLSSVQFTSGTGVLAAGFDTALHSGTAGGGSTVGNGGMLFANGAGTEDITSLLAYLYAGRYYRIAAAQNDATNAGRWVTQLDEKAGAMQMRSEHLILATSVDMATAGSLAQTTIDNARVELLWMEDSETPPAVLAAEHGAQRVQVEQVNPNQSYDNVQLKSGFGQTDAATIPNRNMLVAALDYGLTPLKTVNGTVRIVRAMTTRTRTSDGLVDTGTIDVADSAVADDVRDVLVLFWTQDFAVANPYIKDDPAPQDPPPLAGIAYPLLWSAKATGELKTLEAQKWLVNVDRNPVVSQLNPFSTTPRIVFYAPAIRLPHQHQIEGTVAQTVFTPNPPAV